MHPMVLLPVALLLAAFPVVAMASSKGAAPNATPASGSNAGEWKVAIPFEKYTLKNGLEVILSEDHAVPQVMVELWYHVGSAQEKAHRTGFAHLFEHLMFQGSQHHDSDYFFPLQEVGAQLNGSTNLDRTNFFEQVPSEYLPLALWLEADRMGWLLPALDDKKLQNQKDVVRNERRQRYENRPYGEVWLTLLDALFPDTHPYHHSTIGNHEDVEAASLADVSEFFEAFYHPANATLTIVGDFEPKVAREWVEKTFGAIPASVRPPALAPPPVAAAGEKVIRQEDDVPLQKVWLAWPSSALFQPGDAELDVLSDILSAGKESRLFKSIVREKRIADDINASQSSSGLSSIFTIEATVAEGHTTDEAVAAIDAVLDDLVAHGPTAEEVAVSLVNRERDFVEQLRTIASRSSVLQSYDFYTGTPGFVEKDLARYRTVDAPSIQKTVAAELVRDRRVVLHVIPRPPPPAKPQEAAPPPSTGSSKAKKGGRK
jgi:zinc protease